MGARLLGIPAAIAIAVGVPLVIALSTSESAQPEPKAAALKVRLAGESGGSRPAFIGLDALGPPPSEKSVLVDETGVYSAIVETAKVRSNCSRPIRKTGVGDDQWCLVAHGVEAGHELTGTVTGTKTKLALTLDRKNAFLGWPLATLLFGLLVAAVVALWPSRLDALVQRVKLERLLAQGRGIAGLGDWVGERLANGAGVEDLLKTVGRVVSHGPSEAQDARAELKRALGQANLPDIPFKRSAQEEADRTDHRVSDFLQKDGKQRGSHPAAEAASGIEKISAYLQDLESLEDLVRTQLNPDCQKEPLLRINEARIAPQFIRKNEQLIDLDARLGAAQATYATAFSRRDCRSDSLSEEEAMQGEEAVRGLRFDSFRITPTPLTLADAELRGLTSIALGLTIVTCLLTLAFAGVTVHQAAYAQNNTFATFGDYFKLFSAALASGAAATVITLLGYWRLPKSAPT
jgi:hypothetical protein